jgi:hypothetical protein
MKSIGERYEITMRILKQTTMTAAQKAVLMMKAMRKK